MDVVSFNKHLTTFKNSNRVGECWSGPDTGDTYNRAGLADTCITRDLKQRCDHSDPEECAGEKKQTLFIALNYKVSIVCLLMKGSRLVSVYI